jgi:hypothetical protein
MRDDDDDPLCQDSNDGPNRFKYVEMKNVYIYSIVFMC